MKNFLFLLLAIALFSSCNNDDAADPITQPETPQSFIPLTPGSYWIYKRTNFDLNGNSGSPDTDSTYVIQETVLNGKTYAEVSKPDWAGQNHSVFLRDSIGYLVNHLGEIFFSYHNHSDVLRIDYPLGSNDSSLIIQYKMANIDSAVSVPAGNFTTRNFRGTVSETPSCASTSVYRYQPNIFAKNVGLIKEMNFYCYAPARIERELVRYYIAPQ